VKDALARARKQSGPAGQSRTVNDVTSDCHPVKPVSGSRVDVPDVVPVHVPVDGHVVSVELARKAVCLAWRGEPRVRRVAGYARPKQLPLPFWNWPARGEVKFE
jgi:hypothetical protein